MDSNKFSKYMNKYAKPAVVVLFTGALIYTHHLISDIDKILLNRNDKSSEMNCKISELEKYFELK